MGLDVLQLKVFLGLGSGILFGLQVCLVRKIEGDIYG